MKILVKGKLPKKVIKGTCNHCQTIFEFEENEKGVKFVDAHSNGCWYEISHCPFCDQKTIVKIN